MLTHGQMAFVVTNHLADLIPGTTERDCSIAVAPLSHGAGIHALLNVARGAATVLPPDDKLEPETFWQLVEKHSVSNLFTVPTIVKMLVEHPSVDRYDHSSPALRDLRRRADVSRRPEARPAASSARCWCSTSGSARSPAASRFCRPRCTRPRTTIPNAPVGSCGRPRTGMEVAILDEDLQPVPPGTVGEICCRGPAVFVGYHDNPEATAKALRGGWFHTGDLGRMDARGLLYITGRESDMYISGGSNVYPREVEEVLLTHPGVAEVAVLGVPDPKWGEAGVAVVVRRDGAQPDRRGAASCAPGRPLRPVPLAAARVLLGLAAQVGLRQDHQEGRAPPAGRARRDQRCPQRD